ncbi:xisI family protein [Lyngbya aestuarii BL J]|uniref:XisI family protein n=1 Tax=Lyngbya aestuarii BL J TaxID=1348334 RepID=U7QNM4_9CYAN|nr:XisI protein [Lyngbya aestuarii]ERT08725.1 xisI family protein [Lyngbya aestuarii BL J]
MEKLEQYRQAIQTIIKRHAEYTPSHGEIETLPLCDTINDNYLLMDFGWDRTGRVHAVVFHVRIHHQKIWVEWDGTEEGVTQELLDLGVPKEDIVLGFYRPEHRNMTGFAVV